MRSLNPQPAPWGNGDVIDGKYEVIKLLGQGGMGQVHRVRHRGWGIDLAVKSLLPTYFRSNPDAVDRFTGEARTWVSLSPHPYVCGCHYVRVLDGIPRVFAEYVSGGSLADRIRDRRLYQGTEDGLATVKILRIACQMARGLEHAHRHNVLHLDMKPGNVLLDAGDDGAALITDFGLAKALATATVGDGGMTRAYASPEQANRETVTRQSDIYSFAVSVLEMFTGECFWYTGAAAGEVLAELLRDGASDVAPPMLSELGGLLSRCLRENPGARPASMTEVAEELESLYAVMAPNARDLIRPDAVGLRAAGHNNRALSLFDLDEPADAVSEFQAALGDDAQYLDAVYNFGLLRWRSGEITDGDLLRQIEGARVRAGDPWQARCMIAQIHLERADVSSARQLLDELNRDHPDEPEVVAAQAFLDSGRIADVGLKDTTQVPWHPEKSLGRSLPVRLADAGNRLMTGDKDGGVRLWDVRSGELLTRCSVGSQSIERADVSADGRLCIVDDKLRDMLQLWDISTGELLNQYPYKRLPNSSRSGIVIIHDVRLSPDCNTAFVAFHDREVIALDLRTEIVTFRAEGLDEDSELAVSPNGSHLLISTNNYPRKFKVLHVDLERQQNRTLTEIGNWVSAMTFTPDSSTAIIASDDQKIRFWDLRSGECTRTLNTPGRTNVVALSEDGRRAFSGGPGELCLWDLDTGRCLRTLCGHVAADVWMSPDGRHGRSISIENTALSWSLAWSSDYHAPWQVSRPQRSVELSRLDDEVRSLVDQAERDITASDYHSAHQLLTRAHAMPGYEQHPRILRAWRDLGRHVPRVGLRSAWTTRELSKDGWSPLGGHSYVSISDDARVAAAVMGGCALVWDLESGALLYEIPVEGMTDGIDLSADGERVVVGDGMGRVRVWSVRSGEQLHEIRLGYAGIPGTGDGISVAMTGDGKRVLLGSENGSILLWDLASGRRIRTPSGHTRVVKVLWISDDGRTCASAGADAIRLWDLSSGACRREILVDHEGWATSVCMSPRGDLVVATWVSNPMVMWNAAGESVQEFPDQGDRKILAARFSSDGQFIFTGNKDGTITLWHAVSGRRLKTLTGHQSGVWDIRLTPDGRFLLSGSHDGTIRLWELDWDLADGSTR